jgi:hypothetical protein
MGSKNKGQETSHLIFADDIVLVASSGFITPDGLRQQLCGTHTEGREAEAGKYQMGRLLQQTSGTTLDQSGERQI